MTTKELRILNNNIQYDSVPLIKQHCFVKINKIHNERYKWNPAIIVTQGREIC